MARHAPRTAVSPDFVRQLASHLRAQADVFIQTAESMEKSGISEVHATHSKTLADAIVKIASFQGGLVKSYLEHQAASEIGHIAGIAAEFERQSSRMAGTLENLPSISLPRTPLTAKEIAADGAIAAKKTKKSSEIEKIRDRPR